MATTKFEPSDLAKWADIPPGNFINCPSEYETESAFLKTLNKKEKYEKYEQLALNLEINHESDRVNKPMPVHIPNKLEILAMNNTSKNKKSKYNTDLSFLGK